MMRIVFMGSPEFAVPSLNALVDAGHEVAAAYCQPPRPAGQERGVDVDAAKPRCVEDRLGQDQAVGGDHREIGVQLAKPRLLFLVPQRLRRSHLDPELLCPLVHRRLLFRLTASRRARRL